MDAGGAFCGIPAFLDAATDGPRLVDGEAGEAGSIPSDAAIDANPEASDEIQPRSDASEDVSLDSAPVDAPTE
jgi:hypothetical protein